MAEKDIDEMPPTTVRGFAADNNFDGLRQIKDLGLHIGRVQLDDGTVVDGGWVLMRNQWNSASYAPWEKKHQPQDTCINKNHMSGFWGGTGIEEVLTSRGIRTLVFSSANTDQCVGGSLQDAVTKGGTVFCRAMDVQQRARFLRSSGLNVTARWGGDSC
jgi:hypothetical protein